ncbi:class I SAM-dependent methyltransferase [Arcanobacterium phocae]|uniref:class I SAM-dependent methyltransferase n=1 Tax=Arcanobacterium phocae TaxID=131112 RepID=UPI001C0F28A1|nr:class I SAM-dependent methyltransferase [Arcanobacterium phocae]
MSMIPLLLTPDGQRLLTELPPYEAQDVFALTAQLRKNGHNADLVAAALTQSRLRAKATAKFGSFAQTMLFTNDGVEQATRLPVAAHHAQRFRNAHIHHVIDLGCGVGADSMAFAGLGLRVTSVESDADTAQAATFNLSAFPEARVIHADGRELDLQSFSADALWLDPARRSNGKRIADPEQWAPPLSTALRLAEQFPAAGIKVAPGIDYAALPDNAYVEWTSVDGDLLEAVIWLGSAAPQPGRSARIIRGSHTVVFDSGSEATSSESPTVLPTPLGDYIYEPDPAVIRSGGIARLCEDRNIAPVSHNIAYLTGADLIESPLVTTFVIRDVLPLDTKKVRAYLTAHEIGIVEIKKRGTDLDPSTWRKKLKLNPLHSAQATLIATPVAGQHRVIVAERHQPASGK